MYRLISFVIGYLFGGIQSAILYGKLKGINITEQGSGNPGTTNAIRVMGKKAGAIVLIADVFKAVVAICLARMLFQNEPSILVGLYSGIGAIIGHNYPVFFKFKGGKGIATTAGTLIAVDYRLFLISAAIFLICFGITRIVSLSSLLLSAAVPILLILFYCGEQGNVGIEAMLLGFVITALAFYRHKANIRRLIDGTEAKLTSKK
ncbi:acyl-phosphate glycerol 3-phosphate acyltransferase [Sporanaerobium hydrogeniformans]|uniref:Acyl-phosphate glycerol 3-phosphate acyltransferase n=1 Tax=Sporanaerobium hydrogeniformans TaxID=3072179 RepID=A0AC61DCU9_9FIRM|nr:glycerol-3-phosphate 1-O-acyltransferase PlsY [Sporanaerobium hydrogeniformans]PHV71129.1 acyl-phosphate glycerol 3-phosphate acyltransferase [Sporanaerobium hydrogeniformans]